MISSADFIRNNVDNIKSECTDILNKISEDLPKTGLLIDSTWEVTYVPYGLTEHVAKIVAKELKQSGWICEFSMNSARTEISFSIYPNTNHIL
ncbi:hypothetical protein AVP39_17265 [Vibrio parahaemolyticus]|nr:hypothetical protein AVP39_17265 [Vibrio parahaemolyticus]